MTPDNHDAELLAMCAEFWVQKENFEKINEHMDAEEGNSAGQALDKWNDLRDEIEETRPKSIHGLAAKAKVCEFALAENSGLDSNTTFTMAVLRDCALLAQAAVPA